MSLARSLRQRILSRAPRGARSWYELQADGRTASSFLWLDDARTAARGLAGDWCIIERWQLRDGQQGEALRQTSPGYRPEARSTDSPD